MRAKDGRKSNELTAHNKTEYINEMICVIIELCTSVWLFISACVEQRREYRHRHSTSVCYQSLVSRLPSNIPKMVVKFTKILVYKLHSSCINVKRELSRAF